jgi:hypothetical protein
MSDAPVLTVDPSHIDAARVGEILRRTSPWAKFVAIMYFLSTALMVVLGIGGTVMAVVTRQPQMLFVMVYPVVGLLNLIPALYLWKFTQRARDFVERGQSLLLEQALDAQRSYWKFMGIMMIVAFACGVLVFFVAMVAGFWFARTHQV